MDRQIVYPQAIPLDSDLLNTNRNVLVALGMALQDILGSSTVVGGLPCTQTTVASLNVLVGPGRIYSLQNVDGTAYGSLPLDTTDQIVKQGIQLGSVTLATPAPGTAGQSINYLIEAAYQDLDTTPVVLPFYNSSNTAVPFSGPGGLGTPTNTQRKGIVSVLAKAGIPAATGTQTTPAADAGYVGLYVVTVANGQAAVTSANIVRAANAPIISAFVPFQPDGGVVIGGAAGGDQGPGSFNAPSLFANGGQLFFGVPASNSTTAVLSDVGKCINATGNIIIPNNVFSQDHALSIYNDTAGSISIIAGITTMRLAGTATTGTRTLAQRGLATIKFRSGTECAVVGVT
jgi:hypothetical protein